MSKNFRSVLCQKDLRPGYYDGFQCLMGGCRLNCCKGGWHINFGKKDYLTIKKQKGSPELNAGLDHCLQRIREDVDEQYRYGEFILQNGNCPLLRDGKCGLQLEKGEKVLPFVCRTFPRIETPMPSGYLERTLTPACEGVLELLWNLPDGVDFVSDPLPREEWKTYTYEESASPLWGSFEEIRELCVDILQDRRRPLPERLLLLGMALKPLADGDPDVPAWLDRARALLESGDTGDTIRDDMLPMFLVHNVNTVLKVDSTDPFFLNTQKKIRAALGLPEQNVNRGSIQPLPYLSARSRFSKEFGQKDYFFENLIVTVFFHMRMPDLISPEALWKSYVNLCSLYAAYRFLAVMSCREGVEDCKRELFDLLVLASRALIHNRNRQNTFRDDLFRHDSATLAHMVILLAG